ncbi:MAG: hypothetical protein QOC99_3774, partial [Acidobacteriota bacterium]|nr:hypothetical protein [Acidobacteriota bacterium]
NLAMLHLDADIVYEHLAHDSAGEILGFERDAR